METHRREYSQAEHADGDCETAGDGHKCVWLDQEFLVLELRAVRERFVAYGAHRRREQLILLQTPSSLDDGTVARCQEEEPAMFDRRR